MEVMSLTGHMLVILSVKITIINKLLSFFWFCKAHDILKHSIKACKWHLPVLSYPHVIKVGGVNQPRVEKQ